MYEFGDVNGDSNLDWAQDILGFLQEKAKEESDLGLVITRSLCLL